LKPRASEETKSLTKVKGVKVGTWEGEERLKDDEPEVIGQTCQTGKPSY
jgi:hypothetical protein